MKFKFFRSIICYFRGHDVWNFGILDLCHWCGKRVSVSFDTEWSDYVGMADDSIEKKHN